MRTDTIESSLRTALSRRLELDLRVGGSPVTLKPHILYRVNDGTLFIDGITGDIPVSIPIHPTFPGFPARWT
jgi:hypothetical protein